MRVPVPRQKFVNALGGVIRPAGQHVGEPSLRVDTVELGGGDQRVDRFPFTLTPSRRPSPGAYDQNKVPNNLLVSEPSLSTQRIGGRCGR